MLKWIKGRQGTGYMKMLIITSSWPLKFDAYLLKFPEGTEIPPHKDPVNNFKHFRLNIIIKKAKQGGEFVCKKPIFSSSRIKLFRPDKSEHSVKKVKEGTRLLLSIGWALKN